MNTISQERPRVLIVDDQENWRNVLHEMLDPIYEVEKVASYDAARNHLRQRAFHVVVSDQRLVDTDETNIQGIQLLDDVRALEDGTQAIIVTGYPTIEAAKEALRGREAYDYILKYPEKKGEPFEIREYRQQVKEAANKAAQLRQKAITVGFSLSDVIGKLTHERIAETLFPRGVSHDLEETAMRVANRSLYPFQPLARRMGKMWLEAEQICEVVCWSRGQGKAALLRIGKEQQSLDSRQAEWLKENWRLVKKGEFISVPLIGISYTIDGMAFDDVTSLVKGN